MFSPHFTGVASSSDYRRGLGGRPQTRSFTVRNEHSKWLRYNNPTTGSAYYCNEELGVCSFTPPEEGILADGTLGALVQLLQHRLLIDAPQLTHAKRPAPSLSLSLSLSLSVSLSLCGRKHAVYLGPLFERSNLLFLPWSILLS